MRKNALVFITTYLGCNPYSDKLSLESLKEKLKEEGQKLAALKEELPHHVVNSQLIFVALGSVLCRILTLDMVNCRIKLYTRKV